MAIGLPLIIITIFSVGILVVWMFYGSGDKHIRLSVGVMILIIFGVSWYILIRDSLTSESGETSLIIITIISIIVFFIPSVWKWGVKGMDE